MILFGSQATGRTHRWSDVDLIIVSPKFRRKRSFKRSRGFYRHWKLNKPVDYLCYTSEEFENHKRRPTIVREAVKEGIEI